MCIYSFFFYLSFSRPTFDEGIENLLHKLYVFVNPSPSAPPLPLPPGHTVLSTGMKPTKSNCKMLAITGT